MLYFLCKALYFTYTYKQYTCIKQWHTPWLTSSSLMGWNKELLVSQSIHFLFYIQSGWKSNKTLRNLAAAGYTGMRKWKVPINFLQISMNVCVCVRVCGLVCDCVHLLVSIRSRVWLSTKYWFCNKKIKDTWEKRCSSEQLQACLCQSAGSTPSRWMLPLFLSYSLALFMWGRRIWKRPWVN